MPHFVMIGKLIACAMMTSTVAAVDFDCSHKPVNQFCSVESCFLAVDELKALIDYAGVLVEIPWP